MLSSLLAVFWFSSPVLVDDMLRNIPWLLLCFVLPGISIPSDLTAQRLALAFVSNDAIHSTVSLVTLNPGCLERFAAERAPLDDDDDVFCSDASVVCWTYTVLCMPSLL